jgi:chromosome segregation ATPase
MSRRTEVAGTGSAADPADGASPGLPNLTGDLGSLLTGAPCFRARVHGYDRLQVDNYVAWAESELESARREIDHLLARYGSCSAELEISRRLLAQAPKGRDLSPVSDRVRDILRLAADEASTMVGAAGDEADHLLAEARVETDARLRKARQIKEQAVATADEMRDLARQDRAEAAAAIEQARTEADELIRSAAAERNRLAGEAEEARARRAAVQAEVDDLRRQRDDARQSLRKLTDQIGQALSAATAGAPDQFLVIGNRVEPLSS